MMMSSDHESLLQQERQQSQELEQQMCELSATIEQMQEEETQLYMKLQPEMALRAKESEPRSASHPTSPHRPARMKPARLKLLKLRKGGKCSSRLPVGKNVLKLPEVMRHNVRELQEKQRLYTSIIESQKTSAATEETTRAFQQRLHISEPNADLSNQSPATFPGQPELPSLCEDGHKRTTMQQRLKSYLHTQTCRPPEDVRPIHGSSEPWHCGQLQCATMRKVLAHMDSCTGGMDCAVPVCSSTREVVEHWQGCANDECPVCRPARDSLRLRTQVLAKTLEAMNDAMDVAGAVDETTPGTSLTMGGVGSSAVATDPAKRVAFLRLARAFRQRVESEAESDWGA